MTPVVLVEHPIPTSQRPCPRLAYHRYGNLCPTCDREDTVTVAGPVFVSLNGVPCPECGSVGVGDWLNLSKDCPRCHGLGVVVPSWDGPTLLATQQVRVAMPGEPWFPWRDDANPARVFESLRWERRQVIQWKAHDKLLLPVVDPGGDPAWPDVPVMCIEGDSVGEWRPIGPYAHEFVKKVREPWAASLRPGMFVARFDGLEAVEPAITAMECDHCRHGWNGDDCNPADGGLVPLDLEPGVVHHIETEQA